MGIKSFIKGIFGEFVIGIANSIVLSSDYRQLKNITLPLDDGGTTQIDSIIFSPYGIFVIEIKNYKGAIYGVERNKKWMQYLGGKKFEFQNPLHQNYLHTQTIKKILGLDDTIVKSVIMFSGECKFKTNMPDNVCKGKAYLQYIKSFDEILLSETQIEKCITTIQNASKKWSITRGEEHTRYLETKHSKDNKNKDTTVHNIPNETELSLLKKLKELRLSIAKREGIKAYLVFSDATLMDMISKHPMTKEEMLLVSGVGEVKFEKYGERFLELFNGAVII